MAGLLTEAEDREIRDALRLVTDTFMVTAILYYVGGGSLDRFQEDRQDKKYFAININALKEDKVDDVKDSIQGSMNLQYTMLTFNLEYLVERKLCTPDFKVIFDPAKDFFNCKGVIYKVKDVYYDGPLSSKDVLVIVKGERYANTSSLKNIVAVADGSEIVL